MTDGFDDAALLAAMELFLGLGIAAEHRPGVLANLLAARRIAAPLLDWPLPDEAEAAPVFQP